MNRQQIQELIQKLEAARIAASQAIDLFDEQIGEIIAQEGDDRPLQDICDFLSDLADAAHGAVLRLRKLP